MTRIENLLIGLIEECTETSQRATKALRFTPEEVQPGQQLTNAERVVYEFNDIYAIMEMLKESGVISKIIDPEAVALKKAKVEKDLNYSMELGAIEEPTATISVAEKVDQKDPYPSGRGISTKHSSHCLMKAYDDEPIFVLRAKDPTAPGAIRHWVRTNDDNQPEAKLRGAIAVAQEMEDWHLENKGRWEW